MTLALERFSPRGYPEAARDFVEKGFGMLSFPTEELTAPIFEGWRQFVTKSFQDKEQWTIDKEEKFPDKGFVLVDPKSKPSKDGTRADNKQFFHWRRDTYEELVTLGVNFSRDELRFMRACERLRNQCMQVTCQFWRHMDRILPGYRFSQRLLSEYAQSMSVLRLLYYAPVRQVGQNLAKSHTDQCFSTIHIDESHPGLVFDAKDGTHRYERQMNAAMIFPGRKAQVATGGTVRWLSDDKWTVDGGLIEAVNHQVDAFPEFGVDVEPRIAMVFFAHILPNVLKRPL